MTSATPASPSPACPSALLGILAAGAIIGTDRGGASGNPAMLLSQAAVLGARSRAGFKPQRLEGRLPACPADPTPIAGPAPMATLMRLLGDRDAGLITEWAELAHAKGLRVADAMVPLLLDWSSRQPNRAAVVFGVLGKRGVWLASLNAAWRQPAAGGEIPAMADELWQTDKPAERAALLLAIRRQDPARALALVESTWQSDGADERRRFVEVLGERCSMADEPFLESALDNKSKTVRRAAAAALRTLSDSRFARRMNERARAIIGVESKRGMLGRRMKIALSPPLEFDRAWERDGIEEQAGGGMGPRAWWMRQILSMADLSVWTEVSGLEPSGVLEAIGKDDYFAEALGAIVESSRANPDTAWRTAILRKLLEDEAVAPRTLEGLWSGLSRPIAEALVLEAAGHSRVSVADCWAILASTADRWSRDLSARALKLVGTGRLAMNEPWRYSEPVERAARLVSPDAADQFEKAVRALCPDEPPESLRKSIDLVRLRADMHKEFAA